MKLHLGCGKRFIKGFIHIDAVEYEHIDHVCSIDNLSFIPDNSCELIYTCHVLEHFKRKEVVRVIREWHRVLRVGGVLRLSVPDFEAIAKVYMESKDIGLVMGPLFGRQDYLYNIHYNVFDFKSLGSALSEAGFFDIKRYDWRTTEHSGIDDYSQAYIPHMDRENGTLISLNVESVKAA